MEASYSDLEVATKHRTQPGLEFDYRSEPHNYKEAVPSAVYHELPETPFKTKQAKICGLSPKVFWITLVLIVVIVVAAVGGGVGGGLLAAKPKNPTPNSASTTESLSQSPTSLSSSPKASTTTSPPVSTTQIVGPTYTLNRDCPSSNNTLYTKRHTSGDVSSEMTFRKSCGLSYLNTLQASIGDVVNQQTSSLNSCIDLCAGYNIANGTDIAAGRNSVCNAVCWRNSLDGDDFPGQCFGFTTQNSTGQFVTNPEAKCDSAAWIDQTIV